MEYVRKLVTARTVSQLLPIKGADFIELAVVDGWTCIVKKGEFNEGDVGLFFEIDSFLPAKDDRFAFLKKPMSHQGQAGYRIKSMKMRKVLSQGLFLPLNMFPEVNMSKDITEQLNVTKYDVAMSQQKGHGNGKNLPNLPSFLRKTDQNRLQNLPHYWSIHKDQLFEETLKLDGSSCTMFKADRKKTLWDTIKSWFGYTPILHTFGVCSRNVNLPRPKKDTACNFWTMALQYKVEQYLPKGYAISGEVIAPNIQSNHEKVDSPDFFIFDIFDITAQKYLLPEARTHFIANYIPHMKHIKITHSRLKIFEEYPDLNSLQDRVTGQSMNPKTISEGRVYKAIDKEDLTFKLISNEYLLKCED